MMMIIDSLTIFVSWLLLTSLKATIVAVLIIIVQILFRKKLSARWLYALWFLLIARLLIPFEVSSPVSIFNVLNDGESQSSSVLPFQYQDNEMTETIQVSSQDFSPQVADFAREIIEPQKQLTFSLFSIFGMLWIFVAFIFVIFTVMANIKIYYRMKQSKPIANKKIITLFKRCKNQMGVNRIELVTIQNINTPLLFGIISPRIFFPEKLLYSLSSEELEHIFLHELAHFKRGDIPVALLATILQIVHWFNPVLWFAFYKMRLNREIACDELVLSKLERNRSKEYGNTLISLLEHVSKGYRMPLTVGIVDNNNGIQRRLKMIANYSKKSKWWTGVGIVLIILIANLSLTSAKNISSNLSDPISASDDEFTIEFKTVHPDSFSFPINGTRITATRWMLPPNEVIIKYPQNYKVKKTYIMNLQPQQYYFALAQKSEKDFKDVIKIWEEGWYKEAKNNYTKEYVDCLVSYCILENEDGEDFVVFDQNNDEDLSNDTILSYEKKSISIGSMTSELNAVQTTVQIDYFNGKNVQTSSYSLRLSKKYSERLKMNHLTLSLLKMELGKVTIGGKVYQAAIINSSEIEFHKYCHFWLDANQNGQLDLDDVYGQMHKPFTILGKTYEITNIDRYGRSVTFIKSDAKVVPPVSVGREAPDFSAMTLDSKEIQLSKLRGKTVLIDFWGTWCGPCIAEIPYLKKAHSKYKTKDFKIISIGIDDPNKLRTFVKDNQLNWLHIQQNKNDRLEKLYQISGFPSTFLVDKNGIIVAKDVKLRGDNLLKTLDKFIDQ